MSIRHSLDGILSAVLPREASLSRSDGGEDPEAPLNETQALDTTKPLALDDTHSGNQADRREPPLEDESSDVCVVADEDCCDTTVDQLKRFVPTEDRSEHSLEDLEFLWGLDGDLLARESTFRFSGSLSRTAPILDRADLSPATGPTDTDAIRSCLVRIYPASASGVLVELDSPRVIIGRDPLCDVEMNDDCVSRIHTVIERIDDNWWVSDCDSLNGTIVNDERVDRHRLSCGDQLHVGKHIFKFLSSDHVEKQYHEAIYEMMTVDALTEVYNRRYFEDVIAREVSKALRYGRPLALLMFDIDHFKHINDRFGHLTGDEVLRRLADRIRTHLDDDSILARIGGEEFAVALPEVTLQRAVEVAENLRRLICELPLETSRRLVKLTISAGVAHYDGGGPLSSGKLMESADRRLYDAKRSGRNCVKA